jgi:hypothetical protein
MERRFLLALVLVWPTSLNAADSPAVRGFSVPARTAVPFTYCMDYGSDLGNKSFLEGLRASPPDLLHLFYQIPFKGGLGPTYGHELFTDDILSPDQVPREVKRIQGNIKNLRAAGVRRLIPYVYIVAFFGDPDKRTGFFHFYDRWDDFHVFGLGPKPAADPSLWIQARGPRPLGDAPPDVLHYDACINHPGWSDHLDLVVRQLAATGYDGMFFDVNTQYCFCPYCQEEFDIHLLEKYGRKGLEEVFGTNDHRELNLSTIRREFGRVVLEAFGTYLAEVSAKRNLREVLDLSDVSAAKLKNDRRLLRCYMQRSRGEYPPRDDLAGYLQDRYGAVQASAVPPARKSHFVQTVLRHVFREFLESPQLAGQLQARFGSSDVRRGCLSEPRALLLWVETQRFWCKSMAAAHARLKGVGRESLADQGRKDDFYTVANVGTMSSVDSLNKRRSNGIDLVHSAPMTDMQLLEEMAQPGSLESGVIVSNIFAFRWAMAAGARAGALQYRSSHELAADLSHAEVAAAGRGAFIQPGTSAPQSRKRWKRFFSEHADLWQDGHSAARVGLLFWSDQVFYEHPQHLAMTHRLVHILSETQTPFEMITEESDESLKPYDVIIAPRLRYLEDAQIEKLLGYARGGGKLVVVEPFGTEDKSARPRKTDPLAKVFPDAGGFQAVAFSAGKILRLESTVVPQRRSDSWCLMEERSNAFILMRNYANETRMADVNSAVDLGPKWIQRLEDALDTPLRWCPSDTDAGVYLHPYRVPARSGRPDRIVVHLVNYRLPIRAAREPRASEGKTIWIGTTSDEPRVAKNIQIAVPLPPNTNIKSVQTLSPTDKIAPIRWMVEKHHLKLSVKQLRIYQALVIDLETP